MERSSLERTSTDDGLFPFAPLRVKKQNRILYYYFEVSYQVTGSRIENKSNHLDYSIYMIISILQLIYATSALYKWANLNQKLLPNSFELCNNNNSNVTSSVNDSSNDGSSNSLRQYYVKSPGVISSRQFFAPLGIPRHPHLPILDIKQRMCVCVCVNCTALASDREIMQMGNVSNERVESS